MASLTVYMLRPHLSGPHLRHLPGAERPRRRPLFWAVVFSCLNGCSAVRLGPQPIPPATLRVLPVEHIPQKRRNMCGPAAVCMIMRYWGERRDPKDVAPAVGFDPKVGVRLRDVKAFLEERGYRAFIVTGSEHQIIAQLEQGRPVGVLRLTFPRQHHLEVVVGYDPRSLHVVLESPSSGRYVVGPERFRRRQHRVGNVFIVAAPASDGVRGVHVDESED